MHVSPPSAGKPTRGAAGDWIRGGTAKQGSRDGSGRSPRGRQGDFPTGFPCRTAGFGFPTPEIRNFRWQEYGVPGYFLSHAINGLKNPGWQKYDRQVAKNMPVATTGPTDQVCQLHRVTGCGGPTRPRRAFFVRPVEAVSPSPPFHWSPRRTVLWSRPGRRATDGFDSPLSFSACIWHLCPCVRWRWPFGMAVLSLQQRDYRRLLADWRHHATGKPVSTTNGVAL